MSALRSPDPPPSPLLQAVLDEDEEAVADLLAAGANPNAGERSQDAPILKAADDATLGILRRLVDAGADIEATDRDGATSLLLAVARGHRKVARFLLERGANVHTMGDWSGVGRESPLMCAAYNGDVELARLLIDRGAEPNALEDLDGRKAIHFAASQGHVEMIELLLATGADPWERTSRFESGDNSLDAALRQGHRPAARAIFAWCTRDAPELLGATLHALAAIGDHEGVAKLLDAGVDPNLRDGSGKTPLHWAAGRPSEEMARLILEVAGHATASKRTHTTERAVLHLLLARGADVDARDTHGSTPLLDALAWPQVAAAELLLDAGAGVGFRTHGWSALLLAARAGASAALLSKLLSRGADLTDTQGDWTALTYAVHVRSMRTAKFLLERGIALDVPGKSPLHVAASAGDVEMVELLLGAGASHDVRDRDGKTPRDVATGAAVGLLLEKHVTA